MERKSWWRIVLLSLLFCALSVAALAESYSTLRYLDNGSAVLSLQQALNQLGYSTGGADGKYGPATRDAVEKFQRNNNLKVDGIAGNATQTLLYQLTGGASATPAPDSGSSSSGSTTGGLFSGNYATLKYGSRGDRVSVLQKALNDLGFNAGSVDGNFGLGTQKAVTSFQKSAGLTQAWPGGAQYPDCPGARGIRWHRGYPCAGYFHPYSFTHAQRERLGHSLTHPAQGLYGG